MTAIPFPNYTQMKQTLPIRVWQILNEQNSSKYFAPKVDVKKYAKLLKAASAAIYQQDRKADVVLGGGGYVAGPVGLKAERPAEQEAELPPIHPLVLAVWT